MAGSKSRMELNRGRGSGHPSMWFRGAALYCATLATRSIQPGLFELGSLRSWLFGPGLFGPGLITPGLLANLAKANLANVPTLSSPNPHRLPSSVVREDEHLLVAAAKSGDASAFEELVNRYERKIFRLTLNITRNREDAEDAMQDAFMKSYSHLDKFQEDSRFYTWLVRIAANEALMRLRKRRPNQVSLDEPIEGEDDVIPQQIEDWGPSPEQRFAQTEMREILRGVIEELPPDFRVVFVLRDVEGLSTEETAETVGISEAAVKSRLLRARLKLRQNLNRHFRRNGMQ
jgi:RNA polymerase sigma-70 factor, ECF subfamily